MKLPNHVEPQPANLATDRPEIAKQLGEICCQWANLEATLGQVFANLLLATPLIASEILENIYDSRQKRNAVANLAKYRVADSTDRTALLSLLSEYQTLAVTRSKYVHGRWLIDQKVYPNHAIWVRRVNPRWSYEAELVDETLLADVASKIFQLRKKFFTLMDKDFIARL